MEHLLRLSSRVGLLMRNANAGMGVGELELVFMPPGLAGFAVFGLKQRCSGTEVYKTFHDFVCHADLV